MNRLDEVLQEIERTDEARARALLGHEAEAAADMIRRAASGDASACDKAVDVLAQLSGLVAALKAKFSEAA